MKLTLVLLLLALTTQTWGGAVVSATAQVGSVAATDTAIPAVIERAPGLGTGAVWLSPSTVSRPDGTIEWSLLNPDLAQRLRPAFEHPDRAQAGKPMVETVWVNGTGVPEVEFPAGGWANGCYFVPGVHYDYEGLPPAGSLRDLALYQEFLARGRISAVGMGFTNEEAGSLLRVRLETVIRNLMGVDTSGDIFLEYPYARFEFAGRQVCAADPDFPYRPQVGDEVFIIASLGPDDAAHKVLLKSGAELSFFRADAGYRPGRLLYQYLTKEVEIENLDQLETLIRDTIAKNPAYAATSPWRH